jgi:hypothetical protein
LVPVVFTVRNGVVEVLSHLIPLPFVPAAAVIVPEVQYEVLPVIIGTSGMGFTVPVTDLRVADTQPVFVFRACA